MFNFEKNVKQFVSSYPITVIYICLCVFFSLIVLFFLNGYREHSLLLMGALNGNTLENGEFWRFITYSIGHMSLFHLIVNIPFLMILSRPLEKYFGSFLYLIILVFLSLLTGITIELFHSRDFPLAGSSGIGYGLIGIYMYYIIFNQNKLNQDDRRFMTIFSVIGLFSTFTIPNISIVGHFSAFTFGLLMGFITDLMIKDRKSITH